MKASGYGAWWNEYGDVPLSKCVERSRQLGPQGFVIVKWGYWNEFDAFVRAGTRVGVERYVYPHEARAEADHLAEGIQRGAEFAVINAEAEWENAAGGTAIAALVTRLQKQCPGVEMYASVDTRGNRFDMAFQRELATCVTGWMPEIYPEAFQQSVSAAFNASLAAKDFQGKAVLPTIQTYAGVGPQMVADQIAETKHRSFMGCQAYTIAHATDDEWAAFIAGIPDRADDTQEDDCTMSVPWVRDDNTKKSYYIVGGKKRHVADAAQEAALLKAGYISRPEVMMTSAELATIPDA
jgi:hypothetical protein